MDEIDELKRALGASAKIYDDAQLRHLSREIDLMAEFLLDLYRVKRSGTRKVTAFLFDTDGSAPIR